MRPGVVAPARGIERARFGRRELSGSAVLGAVVTLLLGVLGAATFMPLFLCGGFADDRVQRTLVFAVGSIHSVTVERLVAAALIGRWAIVGACGIGVALVSYLLYALTNGYTPVARGTGNRSNAVASAGYAVFAWSCARLAGILRTGPPAAGTRLLVSGAATFSSPGVLVFEAPYDLQPAVQMLWEDESLRAVPVGGQPDAWCGARATNPLGVERFDASQTGRYGRRLVFVDVRDGSGQSIRWAQCLAWKRAVARAASARR